MSITIKDVAEKAGYTIATISRALNNSPLVSEKTREKIFKVAKEMGYYPNEIARGLVKKNLQTVGVIVPDITNPYFPVLVKAIQETLQKANYTIFLCNSDWDEANEIELVKMLYTHRVNGIIMDPACNESYRNIQKLDINLPLVFTGNQTKDEKISYVLVDNYKGVHLATDYLIRLGHKKIGFVGGSDATLVNEYRFQGYKDTMIKKYKAFDESLVKYCKFKKECGYSVAQAYINEDIMPTAIVASDDVIALGIIECLQEYGYKVPENISVIGFNDIEYASLKSISLTTIREPRYKIGSTAVEILLEKMENKDKLIIKQIVLEPELVIRDTCSSPVEDK